MTRIKAGRCDVCSVLSLSPPTAVLVALDGRPHIHHPTHPKHPTQGSNTSSAKVQGAFGGELQVELLASVKRSVKEESPDYDVPPKETHAAEAHHQRFSSPVGISSSGVTRYSNIKFHSSLRRSLFRDYRKAWKDSLDNLLLLQETTGDDVGLF